MSEEQLESLAYCSLVVVLDQHSQQEHEKCPEDGSTSAGRATYSNTAAACRGRGEQQHQ